MDTYKTIGNNIRKRRKQLGITQLQLCEMCNISRSYIGLIERGEKRVSIEILINIANKLHVSLDYLCKGLVDVNSYAFRDEMASYYADIPKEKQEQLKNVIKVIVKEYSK